MTAISTNNSEKLWAIVPAAGLGLRTGHALPKQYWSINDDMTVIEKTISVLLANPNITQVVVAIHPQDQYWSKLKIAVDKRISIVEGGTERPFSIMQALKYLSNKSEANDWVLVHDAVRPCVSEEELTALINGVANHSTGGILAIPVRDTLKFVADNKLIQQTIPREGLWQAQTPQLFRFAKLFKAYQQALAANYLVTDEASAIEKLGESHCVVQGRTTNIKITYSEDLELVKKILQD